MDFITDLKSLPENKRSLAGGKAGSLAFMMQHSSIRIPEGYVICSDAFENGTIRKKADEELKELCSSLDPRITYAVRSSALNEDGTEASFAGQYETLTDVKVSGIYDAVLNVCSSAGSERVKDYNRSAASDVSSSPIAVVIQRFVKPEYAGVIFTSDPLTGADDVLTGNYVCGEGETLVSGSANAFPFTINMIRYSYEGPDEMAPYAKHLSAYCKKIKALYGIPMDIEWAVSGGKVYILQARPITTLKRLNMDDYFINGTLSGNKLLTRTNVGEIFLKPVSPMTFSILEKINSLLGLPDWLDNIYGQAYMNISALCSLQVAFGSSPDKAFERIESLLGRIPEGLEIPLSPFDKKAFLKSIHKLLFPKNKSRLSRSRMKEMVGNLEAISADMIGDIRKLEDNRSLLDYWEKKMLPSLNDGLASIMKESGTSLVPLFSTEKKISKIAGEDLADRLLGGCLGIVESMKPLLLISDVAEGRITPEEYIRTCGHRCASEMELMEPRPYEQEDYVERLIEAHHKDQTDMHALLKEQRSSYEKALDEFISRYPSRKKWITKTIDRYQKANAFREKIRSKGVWIFCVFREFLLRTASINSLGDRVFMLTWNELFDSLRSGVFPEEQLSKRMNTYERYLTYPAFPNIICGRFDPDKWADDKNRRSDFFIAGSNAPAPSDSDIKGFPGAAGCVTGKVRVVCDIRDSGEIQSGEILVTTATNIGWTPVFSKVSAIVTDIGAPLSHAAIVAREFGIPAIVGCGNATTLLKTGDIVTVDGSAGVVTKMNIDDSAGVVTKIDH